jgi:hypothetical protein
MTRCICKFLVLLTFVASAAEPSFAFAPSGRTLAVLAEFGLPGLARIQDRNEGGGHDRRIQDFSQGSLTERKPRRGFGGGFWGGPYWGYGPRWGHRCESCRSSCDGDQDSSSCKRCRVRCGW